MAVLESFDSVQLVVLAALTNILCGSELISDSQRNFTRLVHLETPSLMKRKIHEP
jgi:hypothetical protein